MTKTQLIEEWQSKIDVSKNASLNDIVTAAEVRELIADAMETMYQYTLKYEDTHDKITLVKK